MQQWLLVSALAFAIGCSSDVTDNVRYTDSLRAADSIRKMDSALQADFDSVSGITQVDSVPADTTPVEPTYPAKFRIQYTSSYCGGARPTEEIVAEKQKLRPLTSSSIKFRNHFTGKEYVVKTNTDAIGEAQMEEGKYDVFLTKDINTGLGTGFDPKCKLWQDQLLLTVKVNSSGSMQDVNIHFICNPCNENMKRQ
jgi:hypothetical protein